MNPIDVAQHELRQRGWSIGDMAYRGDGGVVWTVYAHRGEHQILVRSPTQADAWSEALWHALAVQRDEIAARWEDIDDQLASLAEDALERTELLLEQDRLEFVAGENEFLVRDL
jgi:hypothetical protein